MEIPRRMLFKLGIIVVLVLIAIYMFFPIKNKQKFQDTLNLHNDPNKSAKYLDSDEEKAKEAWNADYVGKSQHWSEGLHISVVACGERLEESLVMLKSAAIFSKSLLVFHIFAEEELQKGFQEQLDIWPPAFRERVEYHIYNITFPSSPPCEYCKPDEWKRLFKPCASQRLFIPDLLRDVDSLVYLDTDVLFLSPVEDIWTFFTKFNSTQFAAVAPEHEDKNTGWYNRFTRHPFYGPLGINSGVLLMNLTRMRASTWLESMRDNLVQYKQNIRYGDQDLINIYFHFHSDQLYVFPCEWNYRSDHCWDKSSCKSAEKTGAFVLHGSRGIFHVELLQFQQHAFKAVYKAFKDFRLGGSIQYELLRGINTNIQMSTVSNCGKLPHIFTKRIETHLQLE